jgi:NitT/TauT family transport system substrate-binding protein
MKFGRTAFAAGIGFCLASYSFAEPASAEPPLKRVMVAYTSFAPSQLWGLLENELGYFREEGLRPEFVLIRGGSIAVKGLIAGNFDYMVPGGVAVDAIIRGRQPLKIVFTAEMVNFWLVAQPEIRSIAELKGKTVGINAIGGNSDFTMREILRRNGLDPVKDMTFLAVGASSDRFNALVSGTVQSALLSPPGSFMAVQMGYRKLAGATDYVKWPQAGLATREEKILKEPEETARMVRASLKSLKFMLTQREYILSKIVRMFRLSREDAARAFEGFPEHVVSSGYLNAESERAVISMSKQGANVAEEIPIERVFDNRFVKQAERELKGWQPSPPKP